MRPSFERTRDAWCSVNGGNKVEELSGKKHLAYECPHLELVDLWNRRCENGHDVNRDIRGALEKEALYGLKYSSLP
jgi:hypothetical protein